jgi:Tol biopolymer transport system component
MQIWKIKSNGDSLTQVTKEPKSYHYYPVWSPDGKKMIFLYNSALNHPHARVIDADGNLVHDLDDNIQVTGGAGWSPDGQKIMALISINNIWKSCYINAETYQTVPTKYSGAMPWFPDSRHLIVLKEDGLYIWDMETGSEEKIKNHCNSKEYAIPSVSSNGKKIFVSRIDQRVVGENLLYREQNIVMMDEYGNNEEILPLK